MAGLPWFELDTDFSESPKVRALCARLREPLADAYVSRIYAYCYRHARDRFEVATAEEVIEEAARWKGKRGALLAALESVHVVDRDGSEVVVHGVADRLAPHLAKRTRDAERMAERRNLVARTSPLRSRDVAEKSRERRNDVAGDKDKDKDIDSSEITIGYHHPPISAPLRAARMGVGHPAWEAAEHWIKTIWPRLSASAPSPITTPQAQALGGLCSLHGVNEVRMRMDRAAADSFWADKLDLDTFLAKFDRFAPRRASRPPEASAPSGPLPAPDPAWLDAHPGSRERWAEYETNARSKAASEADTARLLGTALFLFRSEFEHATEST